MDLPLYLKVIVLGILEGATEFLPVSSTGHLIIANDLLSFTGERAKTFDIFIQLGAICAIVWHYRRRIGRVSGSLLSDPAAFRFAINVLIGFLPAALLGLLFHKTIKTQLFNPITVAGALIVGGFIILLIERRRRTHRVENVDDLTWHLALKVGFAQSLALFPGVSRAGATIMGGLLSGMSRSVATEFSFFLAIPTMFAATFYDLYKNLEIMRPEDFEILAIGFVAAFFSAWLVIRALLAFVARHSFKAFAWYRIVLGSFVLIYFLSSAGLTVPL
ncbi:undecaprenyl-diphosphate phosphatase [Methylocaldum sp. MU1018]